MVTSEPMNEPPADPNAVPSADTGSDPVAETSSGPIADLQLLLDELAKCGKCGFCLPACPIYRATGLEPFVARGKVQLLRALLDGRIAVDDMLKQSFENCLMCRACTASCFTAVRTDDVVRAFRESYAEHVRRSSLQKLLFRHVLPRRPLMSAAVKVAGLAQRAGLDRLALRSGLPRMLNPKLDNALRLEDRLAPRTLRSRAGAAPRGSRNGPRIGYWVSCGYDYFLPEAGLATLEVLAGAGAGVTVLGNNCCGLPAWVYGDTSAARALAVRNLRRIGAADDYDLIVSDCASCTAHLKEYGSLLAGDAEHGEAAARFSARVRNLGELPGVRNLGELPGVRNLGELPGVRDLGELPGVPDLPAAPEEVPAPVRERRPPAQEARPPAQERRPRAQEGRPAADMTVTYHEPCHLGTRYQDLARGSRDLIRSIPGVRLIEMGEADACCGAAGSYGVVNRSVSLRVLDRKVDSIVATGAAAVVTECPACMMQLEVGLRRRGLPVRVMSLSQLLRRSPAE